MGKSHPQTLHGLLDSNRAGERAIHEIASNAVVKLKRRVGASECLFEFEKFEKF